jgi:hypothetical protein
VCIFVKVFWPQITLKQHISNNEGVDVLQTCDREDSETYAKRTITEIETCLGFSFLGNGEEEAPEGITNAELEVLNAAYQIATITSTAAPGQPGPGADLNGGLPAMLHCAYRVALLVQDADAHVAACTCICRH